MAPNERTEREFQLDTNQAVANTEAEIMDAALGDEELENDGDTSLEEMVPPTLCAWWQPGIVFLGPSKE
jgi:hypothetical protein